MIDKIAVLSKYWPITAQSNDWLNHCVCPLQWLTKSLPTQMIDQIIAHSNVWPNHRPLQWLTKSCTAHASPLQCLTKSPPIPMIDQVTVHFNDWSNHCPSVDVCTFPVRAARRPLFCVNYFCSLAPETVLSWGSNNRPLQTDFAGNPVQPISTGSKQARQHPTPSNLLQCISSAMQMLVFCLFLFNCQCLLEPYFKIRYSNWKYQVKLCHPGCN